MLVVVGHAIRGMMLSGIVPEVGLWGALDRAIYAFHMPLMFVLSGLFLLPSTRQSAGTFLLRRLRRLIWPLILWTYIFYGIKIAAGDTANTASTWADFPWFPLPPRIHFWFLWALFIASAMVWVLRRVQTWSGISDLRFWTVVATLSVFGPFIPLGKTVLYLNTAIAYFPFLVLGMLVSIVPQPALTRQSAMLAGAAFVGLMVISLVNPPHIFLFYACGAGLSLAVCALISVAVAHQAKLQALLWLGPASMAIYMGHTICSASARTVLIHLGTANPAIHLIGETLAGLLIPAAAFYGLGNSRLRGILGW